MRCCIPDSDRPGLGGRGASASTSAPPPRASIAALRVPRGEARVFPVLRDELAPRVFAAKADPDGSVYLVCRSEAETAADLLACRSEAQPAEDAPSILADPAEPEPVRSQADVGPFAAHPPATNAQHVDPAADFDGASSVVAVSAGGAAAPIGVALAATTSTRRFSTKLRRATPAAGHMIRPLRVIMPLYNEKIYFVSRSDAKLNAIQEIKDAKINAGVLRSGTAMSATTLYKRIFGVKLPDKAATFFPTRRSWSS